MRVLEINNEERSLTFNGQPVLLARWSEELAEDLAQYNSVDLTSEIAKALLYEIGCEYDLTDEEKEYCMNELLENFS